MSQKIEAMILCAKTIHSAALEEEEDTGRPLEDQVATMNPWLRVLKRVYLMEVMAPMISLLVAKLVSKSLISNDTG